MDFVMAERGGARFMAENTEFLLVNVLIAPDIDSAGLSANDFEFV